MSNDINTIWSNPETLERLKNLWGNRKRFYQSENYTKRSAVLMPFVYKDGEYCFLFEQRSSALGSQPGEICFPGGLMEGDESGHQTAIRETCEELLIDEDQIDLIAPMDVMNGPTGSLLWSYLGEIKNYDYTFSPDEVDHVFTIPVAWFIDNMPRSYMADLIIVPRDGFPYELIPDGENYPWRKKPREILFYEYDGYVIWGLTARLVYSFVSLFFDKSGLFF